MRSLVLAQPDENGAPGRLRIAIKKLHFKPWGRRKGFTVFLSPIHKSRGAQAPRLFYFTNFTESIIHNWGQHD